MKKAKKARGARKTGKLFRPRLVLKARKIRKAGKKRKPNAAFMVAMSPSATLAAVIGSSAMPRTEITKRIWGYIKRHKLQDTTNPRMINADDKLKAVFRGRSKVSMFEVTTLVNRHLGSPGSGNNPGPRNKERN